MKPVHVNALEGSVAEKVLISDDYDRIKYLSGMLKNCKLVSDSRGFLVYTGEYGNTKISLASHGIGGPSCAILVEEIIMLGAKTIVMLGTTGTLTHTVGVGEYVLATEAKHPQGGIYEGYNAQNDPKLPNPELAGKIAQSLAKKTMKFHTGRVYCSDTYFAENSNFIEKRKEEGCISVEMESATLFMLGKIRNISTAAVFTVSNDVLEKKYLHSVALEEKSKQCAAAIFEVLENMNNSSVPILPQ